jgi:hypothetical protein
VQAHGAVQDAQDAHQTDQDEVGSVLGHTRLLKKEMPNLAHTQKVKLNCLFQQKVRAGQSSH